MSRLILLVCKIHDDDKDVDDVLDEFRDDIQPGENYGLTIYRATPKDVDKFDLYGDECFIPVARGA